MCVNQPKISTKASVELIHNRSANSSDLHMHVVLKAKEFREFSTYAHDWKSGPVHDVTEVIIGDLRRYEEGSAKLLWNRILMVPQELTRLFRMKGT
ncbi:hypothetical protein CVT25_003888 [Psilocybe cyanescens]|uniref:Uncharacterized protein n=1 Tax=Psilocybe cyanescens TaxID=93625 RepID=A0A409XPY3_PSICY|nr:hypothetical protein CVT25_003888 [Psilocybe cyanescens]